MNVLVEYMLIFYIGALGGWIIELFFRRFVSQKKWVNPGFLKGPYLPLYGFGLLGLYLICRMDLNFLRISSAYQELIKLILIPIVMTVIEYIAGLIFIVGMHIKLWDYSNRKGNIQGIICPLFTAFWGLIGFGYYLILDPFVNKAVLWISANPIFSFFVGAIFGIFLVDIGISFNLANKIRKLAVNEKIVVNFETFKESFIDRGSELKKKVSFLNPFVTNENLNTLFSNYQEKYHSKIKEILTIDEGEADRLSVVGFILSLCMFNVISLLLCVLGRKTTKFRKLNFAGEVISLVEVAGLVCFSVIYILVLKEGGRW